MKKLLLAWCLLSALIMGGCGAEYVPQADMAEEAQLLAAAADQLIKAEYDAYADYLTADEYRLSYDSFLGVFGGIGISMIQNEPGTTVVYAVMTGKPADVAGVLMDDVLVAADGEPLEGLTLDEVALLIRGEIGSTVQLTVRHTDGREETLSMMREQIEESSVSGQWLDAEQGIAYISITSFSNYTANEFVEVFNELAAEAQVKGIVLDLRSNGGGSFPASINIANFFVPKGQVIIREKTMSGEQPYIATSGQLADIKIAVLQNIYTASASEVLTVALKEQGAVTVGSRSYGKGITQAVWPLNDGSAHQYTQSHYYSASGYDLHGVGIPADIEADFGETVTSAEYFSLDAEANPFMAAALQWLEENID
ncbi:MAG: PDZ domain-containing protein [Firmicutes bacterium]|nr:PDZ domain-containing protein [Bacillota bacterium]